MELECDHTKPYQLCTSRDKSSSLRTHVSAAYSLGLLTVIVEIAALIARVPILDTVEVHQAQETYPTTELNTEHKSHDNFYVSFLFDMHTSRSMDKWKHKSWYRGQDEGFLAWRKLEIYRE